MAGYSFETMSQAQAAAFTAGDYLFFISNGATANEVSVAPYSGGFGTGINLTFGGKTLTFPNAVSTASTAGQILFNDNSHLQIGTDAGVETFTPVGNTTSGGVTTGQPNTVFGLGTGDNINFATGAAGVANYLNGGFGADTINGGASNNHIYGNSISTVAGATDANGQVDGGDTITASSGSNYVNGNAGNDQITVGVANTAAAGAASNASKGFNHLLGGADNDTITVNGAGLSTVNGNTGNDTISAATATGDNTLRGGQGDDQVSGGLGHDVLMGDNGSDTLVVHGEATGATAGTPSNTHITVLTGGQGADTFDFSAAGAGIASTFSGGATTGGGTAGTTYYQEITDFTVGTDHIHLATNPTGATSQVGTTSTVFANIHDAEVFAKGQLTTSGGAFVVSAVAVGSASNTYLFYNDTRGGDPTSGNTSAAGLGIIHLDNVTASSIANASFQ